MFSPLCSVNMLEPMARVSFRFLGCLRVCRTVDPTGITLSLVCWAPIVLPADHCTMPFTCTLWPGCVRGPGLCSSSPHPRAHFTSGTRAPATSLTSRSSSAYHGSRETPRMSGERDPHLFKRRSWYAAGLFTFLHVNYRSLSLAAPRHI